MLSNTATIHLTALLCTLFIEGVGMAVWARLAYPHPKRAIVCTLATNLIVHTLFWYSQPYFTFRWPLGLYIVELLVVLIEGTIYARILNIKGPTPWLLSFALNTASLAAGLWLWQSRL